MAGLLFREIYQQLDLILDTLNTSVGKLQIRNCLLPSSAMVKRILLFHLWFIDFALDSL